MTFDASRARNLTRSAPFNWPPHGHRQIFDDEPLINDNVQVYASVLLCIVAIGGALLHVGVLVLRYYRATSFSRDTAVRLLFDCGHLINVSFTHTIIIAAYRTQTASLDDLRCPLSTFIFSLASLGAIGYLCVAALCRYGSSVEKQSMRHRLSAHRIILIASLSWLLVNFPKIELRETSPD